MSEQQPTNWYKKLISQLNNLAEEFGLDPLQTERFRDFAVSVAKDQFKSGNKSGIAWAFRQMREKNQNSQTASV